MPRAEFDPPRYFPYVRDPYRFDARAGLLLAPNHESSFRWKEHRGGRVRLRTNNRGLLEDGPTELEKSGLRILVLGDSHLMVVSPDESFPNLLEAQLRAAGHTGCEVLTSGVGYTGPRLYLRRLETFLDLEPDVCIVSFFAGNDFWDDLLLEFDIELSPKPPLDAGYSARLNLAKERSSGALYQGLNQAHFFKHWPGTAALALERSLASREDIRLLCLQRGMLFLVVILPTKVEVDLDDEPEARAEALAELELSEEEASICARLSEGLALALGKRGVACVDPTAAMRTDPQPFYWRADHHLSVAGHARVAGLLFEALEPLLSERGWR